MTLLASVSEYCALPRDGVSEWTPGQLDEIDAAVLFVLATWSGQSLAAFKKLTERLAQEPDLPAVLMCDLDLISTGLREQLGLLRGLGETFWVRNGRVFPAHCETLGNPRRAHDWSHLGSTPATPLS